MADTEEQPVPANIVRSVAEAGAWWRTKAQALEADRDALQEALAASEAREAQAVEALEFYADPAIWGARWIDNQPFLSYADLDGGRKARVALAVWRAVRE